MFGKRSASDILKKLRKRKAKRVLIQIPEGLKTRAFEISRLLEKNGFTVVVSVEPCFGACDLRDHEARALGCDVLLHIGHTDIGLKTEVPVIYGEAVIDFDAVTLLKKNVKKLEDFKRIGLVASIQYTGSIEKVKAFLEKQGKKVFMGKSERSKNMEEGQVLGCDFTAAETIDSRVDCFLLIGSGRFHLMGLVNRTNKPVFFLDAENKAMEKLSVKREKLEIKRLLKIEKVKKLKNFAVFVSTKQGQMDMKRAEQLRKKLKRTGGDKNVFVITADMLTPEKIMGMGIEVIVNTACPRISDDYEMFGVTILNPEDVDLL